MVDYIKRFNEELLKVSNLQDAVAFATLMSGSNPVGKMILGGKQGKKFLGGNNQGSKVHSGDRHMSPLG